MGRHRKASARKRTLALAALPMVSTLPFLGAAPASASSAGVWDKLAQCESSGNWSINTGNGYYGGVQFSRSTWLAFGGGKYASRADLASKSQQIEIARKVQKAQGWNAWPGCNRKLGGLARLDSGDNSDPVVSSRASRSTQRKAVTTVRAERVTKAVKAKSVPTKVVRKKSAHPGTHIVKAGDTLSGIAAMHRIAGGWRALATLNRDVVKDADVIYPGQLVRLVADHRLT